MKKFLIILTKILVFFIGWAVCVAWIPIPDTGTPAIWRLWAEVIPFLVMVAFTIAFWLIEKKRLSIPIFQSIKQNFIIGSVLGVVWLGATVIIMLLLDGMTFIGKNSVDLLGIWIIAAFLNVVMQELLIRGYLYQLLKKNYGYIAAVIVTTALFTLLHGGALEAGIIPALNVVTMSLFMTAMLEYTNALLAPIIVHALWNIIGAIILGGVSLAGDYPHLFNTSFSDNVLLSGGSCKIEGSVIVLVLNICLFTLFMFLSKRKQSNNTAT